MDRWQGKIAVVTGASAGIGACICSKLVEEGLQVVGLARREERIIELSEKLRNAKGKLHAVKCDVSKKNEIIHAFKWVKENLGPVHILINNAGLYRSGTIMEGNPEDWQLTLDANVLGSSVCSQQAMQQMRENNIAGHIILMNSLAGHTAIAFQPPILNIYSPSKYAVTCLSEILRQEIAHYNANIKVTNLSPGVVKTDIFISSGSGDLDYTKYLPLSTEDVTNAVVYALGTRPGVEVRELTIAHLRAPINETNKNANLYGSEF